MPASALSPTVTRVSERVWFAHSSLINWAIVRTPRGIVLIDAGYADHVDHVLDSVALVSHGAEHPELVAILVTHAHTDHIGAIPGILRRRPGVAVLAAAAEVAAVRGPEREQITLARMGLNLVRPRFLAWLRAGVGAGGLRETAIPSGRAFTAAGLDDCGIRAIPAPGHTVGSTAYEIDDALVTGDAYVTDHLSYARPRAGAIDPLFNASPDQAELTAESLSRANTILPGHGPALIPALMSH